MKQLKTLSARMQADGVDTKNQSAVKEWVEKHKTEIESGQISAPQSSPPKTFVKSGPTIGRNAPCTCGSGKKYKKCCGR